MAALKKQGAITPAAPSQNGSASATLQPAAQPLSNAEEIQRRIEEAKARVRQSLQATPTYSPPPLPLGGRDKRGLKMEYHPALTVDGTGQLNIKGGVKALVPKPDFATVKANQRLAQPKETVKKEIKAEDIKAEFADPTKNPYFDPNLQTKSAAAPKERGKKGFRFIQHGRFINEANQLRAKAQLEKLKAEIAETATKTGIAAELELVSDQSIRTDPPPPVEWWDAQLAPNGYDSFDPASALNPESSVVTNLVQHPIPIQPPLEPGDPKPMPLMLTKKEQKKLRRQRRLELQKEKQDKIRLGLLPPDQPKVKISNLMRVLGTEAVQDPTQVEALVQKQMAARRQKHKDLVASTKLTDEQRKEKKRKKITEDAKTDMVQVAVFRINDLTHPSHRYKVDINAQQWQLTGCALVYSGMSLVIVEGGPKGIKAYKKLLLRRIDWSGEKKQEEDDDDDEGTSYTMDAQSRNQCVLVWEGEVAERAFKFFKMRNLPTEGKVREYLEKMKVVHYWDAAKNYSEGVVM
ncbi:pre-mRNA processing factor 3-domain-containing protein [Gaertneriomyces semiglobifer]|nr:pre-mRNA processing factor 3-domain-containing protein [Gaertneriomyces semiglobifer]